MAVQPESSAEEVRRLRRCINDLVSVLALPAIWTGGGPSHVAGNLLDALIRMLNLDIIYVRLGDEGRPGYTEMIRIGPALKPKQQPQEISERLRTWLTNGTPKNDSVINDLFGGVNIALVSLQLGLHGEMGVLVAGSGRPDFPQETERLVLSVAANQAAIGLQEVNVLRELDQRVAQRTAELAASNAELRKEIAERKSAEERLRKEEKELKRSEAHKSAILNSSLDCILAMDHEGRITEFNPAAERVFGYAREKVLGKPLADVVVPPSLREKHRAGFERHLATGESRVLGRRIEMSALRADGTEIPVELAITRIPQDGPPSFTGYLRDITERKRNEAALLDAHTSLEKAFNKIQHSEARLRQVIDAIPTLAWCNLPDGPNEFLNKSWHQYTGLSPEESHGWGWQGAFHPDDLPALMTQWQEMLTTQEPGEIEARIRRHDGAYRWFLIRAAPYFDEGKLFRWYGTSTDIDDRKRAEDALSKARAELAHVAQVTSLSTLTASIAHEVNQPLSGIVTNAGTCLRMLDAHPPNLEGARETARRTIRDGNRASEVVTRLRGLFSRKNLTFEPFDLNEAAEEVIALLLSELQRNGVVLKPDLATDLPTVFGDRIQIQQVILNLIKNGSDAMSSVENRPREMWISTASAEDSGAHLSVKDAGVGFDPQSEEKLFQAFYTTKSDGMGIGLSVSRSIMESHHGRLWAVRNDGPGTTFVFYIPYGTNTKVQ
jgi:PAS domain S-box-containing protein